MMGITELPAQWREWADGHIDVHAYSCADELQAALPAWTKITEDPGTWPDYRQKVMMIREIDPEMVIFESMGPPLKIEIGAWWRPLCDLDTPPQPES